jgi:hypothetical protein
MLEKLENGWQRLFIEEVGRIHGGLEVCRIIHDGWMVFEISQLLDTVKEL